MVYKKRDPKTSKNKRKIDELKSAEEKFQMLVAKRDELNQQALAIRDERDALNEKKKELRAEMDDLRDMRRKLSQVVGEHKKKRDELQDKAKGLIDMKKKLRSALDNDAKMDLSTKRREMKKLEMDQQTIVMPIEDENEIVDRIRKLYDQITELEGRVKEQKDIQMSVSEINAAIDEAFELANIEHRKLMVHVSERREIDDKITAIVNEIGVVIATADKKHKEFLDARDAADAQHMKAKEMRDKILEMRAVKRAEREEQRQAINEVNSAVKKELLDKNKLDKAADKALAALLSKGKIEL
jgi:uncharacterized coiled-coil DUF342 family protein